MGHRRFYGLFFRSMAKNYIAKMLRFQNKERQKLDSKFKFSQIPVMHKNYNTYFKINGSSFQTPLILRFLKQLLVP